ncbi:MAG TPA: hypothetical protein PLN79_08010 [bacterium]|nr:hypothetical protein [bacterium]
MKHIFILWILAGTMAAHAGAMQSDTIQHIGAEAYQLKMQSIYQAADSLYRITGSDTENPAIQIMRQAEDELPVHYAVVYSYRMRMGGDSLYTGIMRVDNRYLKRLMQQSIKPDGTSYRDALRTELLDRLYALDELAENGIILDSTDYRAAALRIAADKYFQPEQKTNVFSYFIDKFFEWLRRLFSGHSDTPETKEQTNNADYGWLATILLYSIYAIGLALLVYIIYWAYKQYRRNTTADEMLPATATHSIIEPGESTDYEVHASLATQYAVSGDYRKAIRHLYIALILELDARLILRFDKAYTINEYLTFAKNQSIMPELLRLLIQSSAQFEYSWYGHQITDRADFERLLLWYNEARNLYNTASHGK